MCRPQYRLFFCTESVKSLVSRNRNDGDIHAIINWGCYGNMWLIWTGVRTRLHLMEKPLSLWFIADLLSASVVLFYFCVALFILWLSASSFFFSSCAPVVFSLANCISRSPPLKQTFFSSSHHPCPASSTHLLLLLLFQPHDQASPSLLPSFPPPLPPSLPPSCLLLLPPLPLPVANPCDVLRVLAHTVIYTHSCSVSALLSLHHVTQR